MDPDEALKRIRAAITEIRIRDTEGRTEKVRDVAVEMAAKVEALDEWLSKGGFKPVAWQGIAVPYPPLKPGEHRTWLDQAQP